MIGRRVGIFVQTSNLLCGCEDTSLVSLFGSGEGGSDNWSSMNVFV